MKFIIFSILIALALAQDDAEEFDPFMTSPTLALLGEFPSAVIIRSQGNPVNPLCGGTIIDREHILTIAQCVLNAQNQIINPFWYQIDAGDVNILRATVRRETRSVIRVFVHPQYNPITRNNDLAVLRVDRPFPDFHNTIEIVPINPTILRVGTVCRFAAWGSATNVTTAPIQPEMRAMNAPVIDNVACNAPAVYAGTVLPTHICAGSIPATNPATGACRGNLGSGLYCEDRLAGILTFGIACGVANRPGVYMDLRQYSDWINSQIVRTDNPQPGTFPQ